MSDSRARELMRNAWATRRSSFDVPEPRKAELMDRARADLVEAVALCRAGGDAVDLAQALHLLANVERGTGDEDKALTLWQEAVAILREADAPLELAHKVRHVADLHRSRGRLEEAEVCYAEAVDLYRTHGASGTLDFPNALRPMAILEEQLGHREQALALWRETRELYAAIDIEGLDLQQALDECDAHVARLEAQS